MAKNDVTVEDLQATASAKVEDVKDAAGEKFEDAKETFREKLSHLKDATDNANVQILLIGAATIVAAVAIQKFARTRKTKVEVENVTVVVATDEPTEVA